MTKRYMPGDSNRKCWACQKVKPVEQFTKNKKGIDGYSTLCLACKKVKSERWRTGRPDYERRRTLGKYGITLEDYEAILIAQGGTCRICKREPMAKENFHVDHNHTTERVRGLLCSGCNTALGLFKENVDFLKEAILYIERDQAWPTQKN